MKETCVFNPVKDPVHFNCLVNGSSTDTHQWFNGSSGGTIRPTPSMHGQTYPSGMLDLIVPLLAFFHSHMQKGK